ncbi:related to N-acetyltransferase, GNAT family [Cephalotrichum gorgonifer]|uniref:Related to N-acetyltransferase, GNAT family n=1 Tax=Cephalotrichum gorgonifer TaxID=2041049 RepID=A0AAE8MR17_9PEZI|nr:related to N-acetyltransferase, GNAT family [Cephalotrichum gorgonifer]
MANANLQFRLATPEDAPQIQQLIQAAFRSDDSRPNWTADPVLNARYTISVDTVLDGITSPDKELLVVTDANGTDGAAIVATVGVAKAGADLARIYNLALDQRYQRGGLGRQVLTHAEDYCRREWGVKKTGLNALSPRQELISWYMRRGYVKTGTSPFPAQATEGMGLPEMWFVELEKDLDTALIGDAAI